MAKKTWLWITLFVLIAVLIFLLATSWNVVLVQNYFQMVELAKEIGVPWLSIILGTAGFITLLVLIIFVLVGLLREMRLNQMQTEFLARVSHELKSPLATLELTGSLLRTSPAGSDESLRLWQSFDGELSRLKIEVEVLLYASRLEHQPLEPKWEWMSLEEWLRESMDRWRLVLGAGARLIREGDPLPSRIRLDPGLLNLISGNLVDNAKKFARGQPELSLKTRSYPGRRGKVEWSVTFEDRGWGFDPKFSKQIFKRFKRARNLAPYAIPGTGLGLFLAASACRVMGLKIEGRSRGEGEGASFTLRGRIGRERASTHA